jgi:hypothetical protein
MPLICLYPLLLIHTSTYQKKREFYAKIWIWPCLGRITMLKPYQWPILHWVKKWSNTCLKSRVWIFQMWTKTNMYSFHHDSRKWFLKIAIYQPFLLAKLEWTFQGTLWRLGFIASKERKTQVQMVFEGLLCV